MTETFFLSSGDAAVSETGEVELALVRTGTFNGFTITPEDLDSAVKNFSALRDQGWLPGGWAKHPPKGEGPAARDARDRMATITSLRVDGEELLATVKLLGDDTRRAFTDGKLPYRSGELRRGYKPHGSAAELPGLTVTGMAFVDDPAIKALPASMFCNGEAYGLAVDDEAPLSAKTTRKDVTRMSWLANLVALVRRSDEPTAEELANAEAEATAALSAPPAEEATPQTDPEIEKLRSDLAAEKARADAAEASLASAAAEARSAELSAQVAALVSEGHVAPANAEALTALLAAAPQGDDGLVTLAAAEGEEPKKADFSAMLVEFVKANSPAALLKGEQAANLAAGDDPAAGKQPISAERIEAAVKAVSRT